MILVIGGSCQGKRKAAARILHISEEVFERDCVDGGGLKPEQICGKPYVAGYQDCLRRLVETGQDTEEFTRKVMEAGPEVVVMNEVGYGVVPMDALERRYREAVGCAGQMLAGGAEAVYRVVCGVAVRIR